MTATTFAPVPDPFPHCIIDGYWDPERIAAVSREFPHPTDPRWRPYSNAQEAKLEGPEPMWGPETLGLLDQIERLTPTLGDAFGIPGLSMETVGGGYHLIPPGGHLDIHTDFNRSPETGLYRRLNFLVFLNPRWDDPGGRLELWCDHGNDPGLIIQSNTAEGIAHAMGRDRVVIAPEFNRTVVFETSDRSWHGHPQPAARWRQSVAAYFFSSEPPPGYREDHSTVWKG